MTRRVYRFVACASLGFEMSASAESNGGRVEDGVELAEPERASFVATLVLAESLRRERAARQAVEQAQADIEGLLYTVSHDLKSPVLTVLGYIDLLRTEGSLPPGQATQFVERIEASALYMQHLVSDLLELSR